MTTSELSREAGMMGQGFFLRLSGILGALGVGIGAFGAHGLKENVAADMLAVYETGVAYHMYHTLAILAVAAGIAGLWAQRWARWACCAWAVGIVFFSGSLYLLTVTGMKWFGAITPIGGVAFILGWVFIAMAAKSNRDSSA